MSVIRRTLRKFRIGKEKYFVGNDLEGNSFYERPPLESDDWKLGKRTVDYLVTKPLSEYTFDSLPVQWNAWLRRTRKDPPSIDELEIDLNRKISLQNNVARLAIAYREEKLRGLEAPVRQSWAVPEHLRERFEIAAAREGEGEIGVESEALVKDGVEGTSGEIDLKIEEVEEPLTGTEGEKEKALLRRKFARENPTVPTPATANTNSADQPESFTPSVRKR